MAGRHRPHAGRVFSPEANRASGTIGYTTDLNARCDSRSSPRIHHERGSHVALGIRAHSEVSAVLLSGGAALLASYIPARRGDESRSHGGAAI